MVRSMCAEPRATPPVDLAERLQAILGSKDLTLYQVSQRSESLYGRSSPYFLPHTLYYDLRSGTFSLSIYQFSALSRISNCRLHDWLRALGFDVADIARLQIVLPSKRTVLLNSALEDPYAWIPWLANKTGDSVLPFMSPLSRLLEFRDHRRLGSMANLEKEDFLYAKVGQEDALAFPELLPGSIVRVNRNVAIDLIPRQNGTSSNDLFLVEHCKGLFCCRLRTRGDGLIVPVSTQLPYAQVELQLPEEARCLGVVELEIRPLLKPEQAEVPKDLARHWKPKALAETGKLGDLLRTSRIRMNLSLRDASGLSRQAADLLGDEQYFVSSSSLSDYETLDTAPRHLHKTLTVCGLYGLQFNSLLKKVGIEPESLGQDAMPDRFVHRDSIQDEARGISQPQPDGFLKELWREFGDIPFFLRHSLEGISGLAEVSLDDCFWVGAERNPLHPYLMRGLLVVVNRRKRKPVHFRSKPLWEQPLYVILARDGTYLCACCGLENGHLVLHPYSKELYRATRFRYPADVEVVGQVVTIVRKMT